MQQPVDHKYITELVKRQIDENIHVRRFYANYLVDALRDNDDDSRQTWHPQYKLAVENPHNTYPLPKPPEPEYWVLLAPVSFFGKYVRIPAPQSWGKIQAYEVTLRLDSRKFLGKKQELRRHRMTCAECCKESPLEVTPHLQCPLGFALMMQNQVFVSNGDSMMLNSRSTPCYKKEHGKAIEALMDCVDVLPGMGY